MQDIPPPPPGFVLQGSAPPPPPVQPARPFVSTAQPRPYTGPVDAASIMPALIAQESGGRAGVLGPMTQYGQAIGRTQMLPATAREQAQKLRLPYDESLLRGTSPEAAAYQDRLGQAYLEEGLQKTGNVRDALRYYHGGPNRDLWGDKTNAYAEEVLQRLSSGQGAQPSQQTAMQAPPPPPEGFQIQAGQAPQPTGAPGSSRENPIDLSQLTNDTVQALKKGAWVTNPQTGETFALPGDAWFGNPDSSAEKVQGSNAFIDRPDMGDTALAFSTAAAEQIPFADELIAAGAGALSGRGYDAVRNQWNTERELLNQTNRTARNVGGVAGFGAGFFVPGGKWVEGATGAARVGRAAALGGGYGALYGAGNTDGGLEERLQAATIQGGLGAGGGALFQRGADALSAAARNARANPSPARQLSAAGVDLTPGQMMGGAAQRMEDAATSVPILGDAIRNARIRGLETFNEAAMNQALQGVNGNVQGAGRQAFRQADDQVSQAFTSALDQVAVPRTSNFDAGITAVLRQNPLPAERQADLEAILSPFIARLGQGVDGQEWKRIDSELAAAVRAARSGSSRDPGMGPLANKLDEARGVFRGLLEEANPQAAANVADANLSSAMLMRIREAMQRQGTASRGGLFTPGDFSAAVRAGDSSAGNRQFARGEALMQGLSDAAGEVLPSTVPDSGTALRSLFTVAPALGAGGAAGAVGVPIAGPAAVATGAGLFGGAAAYSRPVQKALNAAYRASTPGAARQALANFERLVAQTPALQPVYEVLQSALRPLLLGGQTATPTTP